MSEDYAPTTVRISELSGTTFADVTSEGVKVDTELPTAAAISADGNAAPVAPAVYAYLMGFNGTTFDRLIFAGDAINGLDVDVTRLPFDTVIDGSAAGVNGIHVLGTDGTNAQIIATTSAGLVKIDDGGGSITVDGTLTANAGTGYAPVVTDGSAAGTTGIHLLGTDGTNAQIISTTSAGLVKVDDGGGSITVDGAFPTIVTDGAAAGTTGIHLLGTDGTNAQIISTTTGGFVRIDDGGGSITVDGAFPVSATDGAAAGTTGLHVLGTDGTDAQILSTQTNGHLNIHDGGNSITVDGTVTANAGTGYAPVVTDGSAAGTTGLHFLGTDGTNAQIISTQTSGAVNIHDGGNSITVDGAVTVSGTATVSGTVTANAGTGVFDVTPASPTAGDYLPIRLTDGTSFYSAAASAGVTLAKLNTINSGDIAPAATATANGAQIASGKVGKLMGAVFSSSVPGKYELKTVLNGVATLRAVFFANAGESVNYTPPTKDFITVAESVTAGDDWFAVAFTNLEPVGGSTASLYSSLFWDEV